MAFRFLILSLSLLLTISFVPANAAGSDDPDVQLFRVQLAIAKKGNPRAQYYLGEMHEQGLGTKQDVDEAFKWYNMAAERGDPLAQRKLALREEIMTEFKKEQEAERLKVIPKPAPVDVPEKAEKPQKLVKPVKIVKPDVPERTAKPDRPGKAAEKEKAGPQNLPVATAEMTDEEKEIARIRAEKKEQRRAAVRKMLLDMQKNAPGELFE